MVNALEPFLKSVQPHRTLIGHLPEGDKAANRGPDLRLENRKAEAKNVRRRETRAKKDQDWPYHQIEDLEGLFAPRVTDTQDEEPSYACDRGGSGQYGAHAKAEGNREPLSLQKGNRTTTSEGGNRGRAPHGEYEGQWRERIHLREGLGEADYDLVALFFQAIQLGGGRAMNLLEAVKLAKDGPGGLEGGRGRKSGGLKDTDGSISPLPHLFQAKPVEAKDGLRGLAKPQRIRKAEVGKEARLAVLRAQQGFDPFAKGVEASEVA
ncbi:hypothetical protein BV20DRAFT_984084, partial [Pilatotrama ljubarskyi]